MLTRKSNLPEIQEFLKLSRTFIRQLELIKNCDISDENGVLFQIAMLKVSDKIDENLDKNELFKGKG